VGKQVRDISRQTKNRQLNAQTLASRGPLKGESLVVTEDRKVTARGEFGDSGRTTFDNSGKKLRKERKLKLKTSVPRLGWEANWGKKIKSGRAGEGGSHV